MNGAKAPPAPSDAPRPLPRANWAFPSDCFSKATARTVRCFPTCTCERGNDGSGTADRAGSVHVEHGLADRAQSVREVELGVHDAFEEVGCLSKDDTVDVGHGHPGVIEGTEHRLSNQATEGHIETARLVVGLADTNHSAGACAHGASATMQTRFCCRHGPDVEWASARCPPLIT